MKKSPWIVCSLAALFLGQIAAFGQTTNAITLNAITKIPYGKPHLILTNAATAGFLSNSNCFLKIEGYTFSGTYAVLKGGKSVTITPDADGTAAVESNVVSLILTYVPELDSASPAFAFNSKSVKWSKISIGTTVAKDKATLTISGKVTYTGKHDKRVTKGFSFKTLWTDWSGSAGL
jgi:hypothetical protein